MSESDDLSLGEQQPAFVELLAAVKTGDRTDETIRISDSATVRVRAKQEEKLDIELVLSNGAVPDTEAPSLGQNTVSRLIGDIQHSLKTVFNIPMAVEPDFELREDASSDGALCYGTTIHAEDGMPAEVEE